MLKDHEIAKVVSDLTKIAIEYKDTQQLRQVISNYITPVLKEEKHDRENKDNKRKSN